MLCRFLHICLLHWLYPIKPCCRVPAENLKDDNNIDLLLPFLQSAGALVFNLLGAQHHHKDAAQFAAPLPAHGQGKLPHTSLLLLF